MQYEVDFMPVDAGEHSGDAIAMRFGNLSGPRNEQAVIIIDGGYKDSGELLVKHINDHYNTNEVDLVVLTHPDRDHASGLLIVLDQMKVGALLMHKPWDHAEDIKHLFTDGRLSTTGLESRIEKSLRSAKELEALAIKKGVPIEEPFQGMAKSIMHVLGPSQSFYEDMLAGFRPLPNPNKEVGLLASLKTATKEAINWIQDYVDIDILNNDDDTTSPENNTSTIILFDTGKHKLLFTGDAGKTALLEVIEYTDSIGIPLDNLHFLDVPHHGSKRNLSSKILKRIRADTAFVSASKDSPKHPAKKITNALKKHGSSVFVTRGEALLHHNEGNARGWGPATPEPFHNYVEE